MKTKLTIISDDFNHGVIDEKQARKLLLNLFGDNGERMRSLPPSKLVET